MKAWQPTHQGQPLGPSVPCDGLWRTHIGPTLRYVRGRSGLDLVDAVPRYYPSQRWIVRILGLRELITWACLLLVVRTGHEGTSHR